MTHISPAVSLVWAVLNTALGSFLVFHLWSFDRFKCLKWNHGPHSGTFKRVMTYSYLLSVPLLAIYSIGFTIIKYINGFVVFPGHGIIPTPYELWSKSDRNAILPLYLCFSVAWGLEIVTHLEELCFWLFLTYPGSTQQDWFRSMHFKTWVVGSCAGVLLIPLVTIFTRENANKCEAFTFLIGGLCSLTLTISFLPVLWVFPTFLESLKQEGVEQSTLTRLVKFHELNCIRVIFRFLFTVPLVILGSDGVRTHVDINAKIFPTDFLGILAGIGCVVSSGLTLVIFFPRSPQGEMALREQRAGKWQYMYESQSTGRAGKRAISTSNGDVEDEGQSCLSITRSKSEVNLPVPLPASVSTGEIVPVPTEQYDGGAQNGLPAYEAVASEHSEHGSRTLSKIKTQPDGRGWDRERRRSAMARPGAGSLALQPNRRGPTGDVELGSVLSVHEVTLLRARSKRDRMRSGGMNDLVYQWRSPIDIERPVVVP